MGEYSKEREGGGHEIIGCEKGEGVNRTRKEKLQKHLNYKVNVLDIAEQMLSTLFLSIYSRHHCVTKEH